VIDFIAMNYDSAVACVLSSMRNYDSFFTLVIVS
jgi:hypothetical protein